MSKKRNIKVNKRDHNKSEKKHEKYNVDMEEKIEMKSNNDSDNFQDDSDWQLIEWIKNDESYKINRPILEEK